MPELSLANILNQFLWDLNDKVERKYYLYFLIYQIPGQFGDMMRGLFVSRHAKAAGKNLRVFSGTRFRSMENLVVGNNVKIGNDNFIQALGGVTIGNNTMTAPGVKIWSVNHNFKDKNKLIGQQGQSTMPVTLGKDVWVAVNAIICPGVNLPDGIVVSSGAVVGIKEYPAYSIIAGNPARVIGHREDLCDHRVEKK